MNARTAGDYDRRVSDVGDLLELLHGAGDRWRTVETTIRTWRNLPVGRRALERWREEVRRAGGGASTMVAFTDGGEQPSEHEHTVRLSVSKPDRWREEADDRVSVGRGPFWWSWSPQMGFMSNEQEPEVGHGDPLLSHAAHLDPALLLPTISFVDVARTDDGLRARVQPRPARMFAPSLPHGADAHALLVEPARGVVLRVESFLEGELFHVGELLETSWDTAIPDGRFVLVAPAGETVRSPRELHAELTLEEAAACASFAVFAIDELPEGRWRLHVQYHAAFREQPDALHLTYHRADGRGAVTMNERSAGGSSWWSRVAGSAHVEIEREGTLISLSSETIDDAGLRELAGRLVRV
jgi:hypothetical protein